jgi:hypothetical protein
MLSIVAVAISKGLIRYYLNQNYSPIPIQYPKIIPESYKVYAK